MSLIELVINILLYIFSDFMFIKKSILFFGFLKIMFKFELSNHGVVFLINNSFIKKCFSAKSTFTGKGKLFSFPFFVVINIKSYIF